MAIFSWAEPAQRLKTDSGDKQHFGNGVARWGDYSAAFGDTDGPSEWPHNGFQILHAHQ
ncbi:MAG: hypothetical protein JO210_15685 [Acidobacteriaceae bacterium]|nr:hypothetical protein [Acidobacteriaceae bacterium]